MLLDAGSLIWLSILFLLIEIWYLIF